MRQWGKTNVPNMKGVLVAYGAANGGNLLPTFGTTYRSHLQETTQMFIVPRFTVLTEVGR